MYTHPLVLILLFASIVVTIGFFIYSATVDKSDKESSEKELIVEETANGNNRER